jgi:hypothetical protein
MPLRCGLGYISEEELLEYEAEKASENENMGCENYGRSRLCPKIFTTRTHRLRGEYVVVEGSRYNAKPVEPRIEFKVEETWLLFLNGGLIFDLEPRIGRRVSPKSLERNGLSFPELDLGVRGATFEDLKHELLRLNPRANIFTPFYINLLEPIER